MMNLFINYDCNLNCDYCFIHGFSRQFPLQIDEPSFEKLCNWLSDNRVYAIGILGGEPTLHPRLPEMLYHLNAIGVSPVLFTNGLFAPALLDPLADTVANFVVNYNDPSIYTEKQFVRLHENLGELAKRGCSLSFSKNFSRGKMAYDYLLHACEKYGISKIRYDISRPNPLEPNNFYDLEESKKLVGGILGFVRACEEKEILTGLDCCLPMCFFDSEARAYMSSVSMKFSGICFPSMDIQTDLSVSYCIPMQDFAVPDVTTCAGELGLLTTFSGMAREIRNERTEEICQTCASFGKVCQGGCLALKRRAKSEKRSETS